MSPKQAQTTRDALTLIALILLGLLMLVPLIWTVLLSLKSNGDTPSRHATLTPS